MAERWRLGILGAGRIAQGFDAPGEGPILTMAHAARASVDFQLAGFFDLAPARAEQAEQKWHVPASFRCRKEWLHAGWDVIYIATPDACHLQDLEDALSAEPRAIIVEKPLGLHPEPALSILERALRSGVAVLVNFPLRWHPAVQALGASLAQGQLGNPVTGTLVCSGGMAHNGVHLLDLFAFWYGTDWRPSVHPGGQRHRLLTLRRDSMWVELGVIDQATDYYIFDMRLQCTKGLIELSGRPQKLLVSEVAPDDLFPEFHVCRVTRESATEEAPLLQFALDRLAGMLRDPQTTREHLQMEIEHQRFIGNVLEALHHGS